MEDDYLLISGIQHFCYCRRQWALIHIEDTWIDNKMTVEGHLLHERVHDGTKVTKRNGIVTLRGLHVRSDRLRLTGVCDAVELIPDENGISIRGREGKWRIHPVEYKNGRPKDNACDRLQLVAECICLEEMLLCRIDKASLFYGKTRRREEVNIDDDLRLAVESMVQEMWSYFSRRYTPKVRQRNSCKACSLIDCCMPELEHKTDVDRYISLHLNEDV